MVAVSQIPRHCPRVIPVSQKRPHRKRGDLLSLSAPRWRVAQHACSDVCRDAAVVEQALQNSAPTPRPPALASAGPGRTPELATPERAGLALERHAEHFGPRVLPFRRRSRATSPAPMNAAVSSRSKIVQGKLPPVPQVDAVRFFPDMAGPSARTQSSSRTRAR